MAFEVHLSPHAVREYRKLPEEVQHRVREAVEKIKRQPLGGPAIKRLQGAFREYYRFRVGDYRILYAVSIKDKRVYIDYIQHRRDVYR